MKRIRFQAEYMAPPLFDPDPITMGHIEIASLKLSEKLTAAIVEWDYEYQNTFNENYPPDSGFSTTGQLLQHNLRGAELASLIKKELGNDFIVDFYVVT